MIFPFFTVFKYQKRQKGGLSVNTSDDCKQIYLIFETACGCPPEGVLLGLTFFKYLTCTVKMNKLCQYFLKMPIVMIANIFRRFCYHTTQIQSPTFFIRFKFDIVGQMICRNIRKPKDPTKQSETYYLSTSEE